MSERHDWFKVWSLMNSGNQNTMMVSEWFKVMTGYNSEPDSISSVDFPKSRSQNQGG